MRGPSKSHDQYPWRMDSFFFKFLYGMNMSTEILVIVALNVPSAILNLKRHIYSIHGYINSLFN